MDFRKYVDSENVAHLEDLHRDKEKEWASYPVSFVDALPWSEMRGRVRLSEIFAVVEPDEDGGHAIYEVLRSPSTVPSNFVARQPCAIVVSQDQCEVFPSIGAETYLVGYMRSCAERNYDLYPANAAFGILPETVDVLIRLQRILSAFDSLQKTADRRHYRPEKILLGRGWRACKSGIITPPQRWGMLEMDGVDPVGIVPIRCTPRGPIGDFVVDPFLGEISAMSEEPSQPEEEHVSSLLAACELE